MKSFEAICRSRKREPRFEAELLAPDVLEFSKAFYAVQYATKVIRGRWHKAEPLILQNSDYACQYARDVLRRRWPEAEALVLAEEDADTATKYARDVIRERWPEAEHFIVQDERAAVSYARDVIRGRWVEAEPLISGSFYAGVYAQEVLPNHWGEEVAAMCPCWLYYYAKDEIGGRLPDVLHNQMSVVAMTNPDDPWAKKYFSTKKLQKKRRAAK